MNSLSNLPPGVTDHDIEEAAGAFDEEMTEAEKIEFTEAINAAIPDPKPKTGYCWKCAEEFPMSELIEDDDPYIKDETDPRDKNYQCKKCAEADE